MSPVLTADRFPTMANERKLKVLVSGAGAAGQCAGYWLARHGFDTTVVEQAPAPRIGGFATDLRGAAVVVAERMGISEACRDVRVRLREIVRLDEHGKQVWKTDGNFGAGTGDIEILRDDLTFILHQARESVDGLTYVFDDSITWIDQDDDGVDVTFKKNPPARYDLVIGADGLHSNVRSLVFGPESAFARPAGFYVGIYTIPNLLNMERQWFVSSLPGKFVSVMQYGLDKHTRAMFIFTSPPITFDKRDQEAQKAIIQDAMEDDTEYWAVQTLLDALPGATDLYFDEVTQIHMPSWSRGRVSLIGDAACAPTLLTGQGTSVAVVGAYVLAGELKAAGGDPRIAFPKYEAAMRHYAEMNQKILNGTPEFTIGATWEDIRRSTAEVLEVFESGDDDATGGALIARAANAIDLQLY
jgi:2-polyprenyl-6-methoxyphenol hydroxylase-like FAD-dependent oxidoreductase